MAAGVLGTGSVRRIRDETRPTDLGLARTLADAVVHQERSEACLREAAAGTEDPELQRELERLAYLIRGETKVLRDLILKHFGIELL